MVAGAGLETPRSGFASATIGGVTRLARTSGVVGVLAGLAGCAPEAASFDSREPAARLAASFRAVETNDTGSVNQLIRMLSSDDPAERLVAIRSLERLTDQTLGYHHEASEDEREAAIERWEAWSKDHAEGAQATAR